MGRQIFALVCSTRLGVRYPPQTGLKNILGARGDFGSIGGGKEVERADILMKGFLIMLCLTVVYLFFVGFIIICSGSRKLDGALVCKVSLGGLDPPSLVEFIIIRLFLSSLVIIIAERSHIIMVILGIEVMVVRLYRMLLLFRGRLSSIFCLVFISFAVCEAVLGVYDFAWLSSGLWKS